MRTIEEINTDLAALYAEAATLANSTGEPVTVDPGIGEVVVPWRSYNWYGDESDMPSEESWVDTEGNVISNDCDDEDLEGTEGVDYFNIIDFEIDKTEPGLRYVPDGDNERYYELRRAAENKLQQGIFFANAKASTYDYKNPSSVEYHPGKGWIMTDVWMPSSASC